MTEHINLSIILSFTYEEQLAHITLNNIALCKKMASHLNIEVILVTHRDNISTNHYITNHAINQLDNVYIYYANGNMVSEKRNLGINHAKGELIMIMDGDDMIGKEFLHNMWNFFYANPNRHNIILRPEYIVRFDNEKTYYKQRNAITDKLEYLFQNPYCGALLFSANIKDKIHYKKENHSAGIGHPDWSLNCDLLHHGIITHIVGDTIFYYRQKRKNSLHRQSAGYLMIPSALFGGANVTY